MTEASVVDDPAAAEITARARVLVRTLARRWTPARQLPTHPVHGDIRLGNVAVAPSDDPVYLDFGFAAVRPRIHELAYSLFWIVLRPDDTGRPEQFDWAAIDELIGAYEQSAHSRLDDRERSALPAYLAAVPLYLAGVAGYTPDPVATLRGEEASLRIAEWVLTHLT
ncbi:MAG TPA: phosphotransferase [Acidimicrobiales bacterium]|nr:phosphotransferase [Acidimicrobiales bacterium]